MPDTTLHAALRESVDDVLEKMFFIQSAGEPPNFNCKPECTARLTFEGDPPGWLILRVTAAAARSVAADFLGEEENALTERQIGEVVCELANMICGSVLSRVESTTAFRLAAPRLIHPEEEHGFDLSHVPPTATSYAAAIGEGAIVVVFNTETPAC